MQDFFDLTQIGNKSTGSSLLPRLLFGPILGSLISSGSNEGSTTQQVEAARNIIRDGKRQGVKHLHIVLSKEAATELGASVEGIPLKVKMNNAGTIDIEVDYFQEEPVEANPEKQIILLIEKIGKVSLKEIITNTNLTSDEADIALKKLLEKNILCVNNDKNGKNIYSAL